MPIDFRINWRCSFGIVYHVMKFLSFTITSAEKHRWDCLLLLVKIQCLLILVKVELPVLKIYAILDLLGV
jgi:hypothetical protein